MSAGPTVSVIIPTYNYGRFICDTLESVFAQTYQDFEVIVVDDGSTDDTRQRVEAFGSRVRYIYQANSGPTLAENTGIRASRGTLLAVLGADDIWLPRKLEYQVALMERDPKIGVAYAWWEFIDECGARLPQKPAQPTHQGFVFEQLLQGCFVMPSMCLIRRSCFDEMGLFDPKAADDWDFWLRVAAAGYAFAYVPEILVQYRIHARNYSSGDLEKQLQHGRRALAKALTRLAPDERRTRLRRTAYQKLYVYLAAQEGARGNIPRASAWLAKAVRLEPGVFVRPGVHLALAFALLPNGYRTPNELCVRLDSVIATQTRMIRMLFAKRGLLGTAAARKPAIWSALYLALAILYGRYGRWSRAASYFRLSLAAHPFTVGAALARGANGHWGAVRAALR